MVKPLSVISCGMITGVGLNSPSSCAAIRCGINNFEETRFMDKGGEWITGSAVPLEQPWRGKTKLLHFAISAIRECLNSVEKIPFHRTVLLLCTAEKDRPGRLAEIDEELLEEIQQVLEMRFHKESRVVNMGRVGGVYAIALASQLLSYSDISYCLIVGVDTLLVAPTLAVMEENDFVLTSKNSDGFIPGEAGAAVLVGLAEPGKKGINILSTGFGNEKSSITSEEPLRADGLVQAIINALKSCNLKFHDLDFRITDANGKQYYFKEAALALTRILRERKEEFDIWHPADCIGEAGAAIVPSILCIAYVASEKKYLLGKRMLSHLGNDSGERAAIILESNG